MRTIGLLLAVSIVGRVAAADELPIMRRLSILTTQFLGSAEVRSVPESIAADRSRVTVLFHLSERGSVIDMRANGGSEEAKRKSLECLKTWRFQPTLVGGRPVQMMSGVVFDFSASPVTAEAPRPMPADQISPVLSARCSLALVKKDSDTLSICKKEEASVEKNPSHTAMESLTAHDELGLALLLFGGDARKAIAEFNHAIELAPSGYTAADGEWAQLYWHRGAAEQKAGRTSDALQDFSVAEKSFGDAGKAYAGMLAQVAQQHGALLDADGKHEEEAALRAKLGQ